MAFDGSGNRRLSQDLLPKKIQPTEDEPTTIFNKNTIISAVSNLSTAYNLVNINLAHVIIENQYCGGGGKSCEAEVDLASTSVLVGAILGQLTFGYVGDCLGRAKALQLTMALSILGALASAFAVPIGHKPSSIFYFIAITRFFLGVGVGGVYPLSATIASESSDNKSRGQAASFVFSMQGVGMVLSPLLGIILIAIFGDPAKKAAGAYTSAYTSGHHHHSHIVAGDNMGWSWRILLGIGALPGLLLLPFKVKETAVSFKLDDEQPSSPKASASKVTLCEAVQEWKYLSKLIGTAIGWFLFDITFYGNGLFQSTVLRDVFHVKDGKSTTITGDLKVNLCWQMLVVALIGLPGYYIAMYFMESLGRKNIQLQGFFFMAVVFAILGIWEDDLESVPVLMLILYGLTFFFSNFGPNSTTFILPAETFPPHIRTTMNGFSAAMGKVGATLGTAAFKPLEDKTSLGFTMVTCAVVSLLGLLVTYIFVEDRRGMSAEGEEDPLDDAFEAQYTAFADN